MSNASDFIIENGVLKKYVGPGGEVVIPESVISIGENAFRDCKTLTSVTIPEGVTSIEKCAFYECSGLTYVTVPESMTSIGAGAFYNCLRLTVLSLPDSITSIGQQAFRSSGLTDLKIPSGVINIEDGLFYECRSLENVKIPAGITRIGTQAFCGCSNLKSIAVPAGVKSIEYAAFGMCSDLTDIDLPDTLESFGEKMFAGCQKQKLRLHGVAAILGRVYEQFCVIEKGVLKQYGGPGGDVIIPEVVKEIGSRTFKQRSDLTGVAFPQSLKKISAHAFEDCDQLTEIVIPEGVRTIDKFAFSGCRKASRLVLPSTLKTIEEWAFQSCGMAEIILPEGIELVQPSAFDRCEKVKRITIPASLQWFNLNCGGGELESIEISPDNPSLMSRDGVLFSKDGMTLMRYPCGRKGDYTIPNGVKVIGFNAFSGCNGLTGVTIPEGITEIATQAFHGCNSLTSVTLPASLRSLGRNSFGWCKNLEKVTIQDGLNIIGDIAFMYCEHLTEIKIPDSVTAIGTEAFAECNCLIRTAHWSEMLADAVKNRDNLRQKGCDELRFLTDDPISVFPTNRRKQALLGFVEEEGTDFTTERAKSYMDYAKKNAGKLVEVSFANPKLLVFLCEHQLISAKDFDSFTAEAEKRGDMEKKALLLDYQNRIGTEEVTKARAKKEKAKEEFSDALTERIATRDPSKGIEGMTFVITGKLSAWPKVWNSRAEVQEYLEKYGAVLGSSVTKKTDYLVTNDTDSGSEKNRKAKEYGALVINEEEFNEMIGRHFKDAPQINIPSWLKEIPKEAFKDCKSLISISIPKGVTAIGESSFEGCDSLSNVILPAGITSIDKTAFYRCGNIHFSCPSELTLKMINENRFEIVNGVLKKYYGPGRDVEIPEGVEKIDSWVFERSANLTRVTIPGSVKNIESGTFSECSNLTSVIICEGVTHIWSRAFDKCASLEEIIFPSSITYIGQWAFNKCRNLKNITIPGDVSIDLGAFTYCDSLVSVTILEGEITSIKDWAFSGCKSLRNILLPASVTAIGKEVFDNCPELTIHTPAGSYAEQYAKENKISFVAV